MKCNRIAFVLILSVLALGAGCSEDRSDTPTDDGPTYQEQIVGCWEWVYTVEGGQTDYMQEDNLFWVFTADGKYCDPELDHTDTAYYVACHGVYSITPTLLTIECPSGTKFTVNYEISTADTLRCFWGPDAIVMKRENNPPGYGGC